MIFRRKQPEGSLDTFFSPSAIVSAEEDEAEGYKIPFRWSFRIITTTTLAGTLVMTYVLYEETSYKLEPAIEHELNKGIAPSPTTSTTPSISQVTSSESPVSPTPSNTQPQDFIPDSNG